MPAVISVTPPFSVFPDIDGEPVESGYIYVGTTGLNPITNPIAVFADVALTIPIAQPIRTIGGYPVLAGTPTRLYTGTADYSILVQNQNTTLIYSSLSNKTKLGLIDLSTDVTGTLSSLLVKYDVTAAETAALVVPTNYYYPPGNVLRYGADPTGVADSRASFQKAIDGNPLREVIIPFGTYNLGAGAGLSLPTNGIRITGASRQGVILNYAGAGAAFDGFTLGASNMCIEHFTLHCTNDAAVGMKFGGGAQHIELNDLFIQGSGTAGNTGAGLQLSAGAVGTFSGNLTGYMVYCLQFKYGIQFIGVTVGVQTWTSVSFYQCYLVGRTPIIAGSKGIWMDAQTNGVGSCFIGGTVESFDIGFACDNGGYGMDFAADNEGNNTVYTVGASFAGRIKNTNSNGDQFEASANGAANRWYQRRQLSGVLNVEVYDSVQNLLYDDSGAQARWGINRGPAATSFISGTANPTPKFYINMGTGGDAVGARNYMFLNGQKMHWDSQSPQTTGLAISAKGDICFNSNATVGQPKMWHCTVAGTPGTWVSAGNL